MADMSIKPEPIRNARRTGEHVARSSGFEWMARAGFVARGTVYVVIGILAIKLAVGSGGANPSQQAR